MKKMSCFETKCFQFFWGKRSGSPGTREFSKIPTRIAHQQEIRQGSGESFKYKFYPKTLVSANYWNVLEQKEISLHLYSMIPFLWLNRVKGRRLGTIQQILVGADGESFCWESVTRRRGFLFEFNKFINLRQTEEQTSV